MVSLLCCCVLQVTSYNDSGEEAAGAAQRTGEGASDGGGGGGGGGHIALNYWFHPPDTATAASPYSTDLWARDFRLWYQLQAEGLDHAGRRYALRAS